jgi:DNA-binding PadR family transcriptional regulator
MNKRELQIAIDEIGGKIDVLTTLLYDLLDALEEKGAEFIREELRDDAND